MPVTGDATQNKSFNTHASAIPHTVVLVTALADASDPVNQQHLSGKEKGSVFIGEEGDGSLYYYIATGDQPTDTWQRSAPEYDGAAMVDVVVTPA